MGTQTKIEWTHVPGYQGGTWNPWQGCTKISAGCKNCYMFRDRSRYHPDIDPSIVIRSSKTTFELPLHTKKPTAWFVCSWSDFFHEHVLEDWRGEAMEIIDECPDHLFLILTKRDGIKYIPPRWIRKWPKNVWMGVSVESQFEAEYRIPLLLQYPAPVRFLSLEPLLEPVSLTNFPAFWHNQIHWVICGYESGPGARINMDRQLMADDLRVQCSEAGVPFFFKQWGGNRKINGVWGGDLLNGKQYHQFPEVKP